MTLCRSIAEREVGRASDGDLSRIVGVVARCDHAIPQGDQGLPLATEGAIPGDVLGAAAGCQWGALDSESDEQPL
ncbi:hypothetical protein GCM10010423_22720 [Streptomyces levis]|uniref:Uncharacterized protein n=1 Tax=Streptomyces levis TaxID=285566 RepID=A0ABP6AYA1_9ACTN